MSSPRSRSTPPPAPALLPAPSPSDDDVAKELSHAFFQLMMKRRAWFIGVVAEFGLSPFQGGALVHMDPERPATMSQAAQAMACEPANLTGVIDKLEARGLVERRPSPGDRRVKMLSLTPAGASLRGQLMARFSEPQDWMLALSVRDKKQLRDLLRKGLAFGEGAVLGARNA